MRKILSLLASLILIQGQFSYAAEDVAFASVRAFLEQSVADDTVAGGSVLVYHKGAIVFQTGFGFADIAEKRPFTIETPAVIASISKPLLGTALYCLVNDGKLETDIPITKYLPEFENRKLKSGEVLNRAPTLTQLLTHTSGLRSDYETDGRIWLQDWTDQKSLAFVVSTVAADFPFVSQPGTAYAYSGIGTDVAARVGEVVSGLTRNELLIKYICKPLGMDNTFYRDTQKISERKFVMPTRYHRDEESGKLVVDKRSRVFEPQYYSPSGGSIISTPSDLLRWLKMIRSGGQHEGTAILKPEIYARMLMAINIGNKALGGLVVREKNDQGEPTKYAHTGSSGTNVWIDFSTDTIGIMLTQTKGADSKGFRSALEEKIMESVAQLK